MTTVSQRQINMNLSVALNKSEPGFRESRVRDLEIVGSPISYSTKISTWLFSRTKQFQFQSEVNAIAELSVLLHHRNLPTYTSILGIWRADAQDRESALGFVAAYARFVLSEILSSPHASCSCRRFGNPHASFWRYAFSLRACHTCGILS